MTNIIYEQVVQHYDLLHVTPYMNAAPVVRDCKELSNSEGYLEIDKFTLQHVRFLYCSRYM